MKARRAAPHSLWRATPWLTCGKNESKCFCRRLPAGIRTRRKAVPEAACAPKLRVHSKRVRLCDGDKTPERQLCPLERGRLKTVFKMLLPGYSLLDPNCSKGCKHARERLLMERIWRFLVNILSLKHLRKTKSLALVVRGQSELK